MLSNDVIANLYSVPTIDVIAKVTSNTLTYFFKVKRETEREKETEAETEADTARQRDREIESQRDRETETERKREKTDKAMAIGEIVLPKMGHCVSCEDIIH